MALAAPHRGGEVRSFVIGHCAVGVSGAAGDEDVSLDLMDGIAVAFCGALDNLAQIHAELEREGASGASPASRTPAAVIARAMPRYGKALPEKLRGAFAAVVTDGRTITCFRDHLGFGTLFYRSDEHGFYAATEAKQVVAGAGIAKEPDPEVLEHIFFGTWDDERACALRGVLRLPKATVLNLNAAGSTLRRYWRPESLLETANPTADELQEQFDQLMQQAVGRCLTGADVVSLSGGIDSPAVAAFAAPIHVELSGRPLGALAALYPLFPSANEQPYIEAVASAVGLTLHTMEERANEFDRLAEWTALADGPVPMISLPAYEERYLRARELGYHVVLTGELAELVADMSLYAPQHLLAHGRLVALARHLRSQRSRLAAARAAGRVFAATLMPGSLYARLLARRVATVPPWIDRRRLSVVPPAAFASARGRWQRLQLAPLEGPGVTQEAESVCQAVCGVRARRPWADVDLWQFFLSLPAEVKFPDGRSKTLLRRLLRGRVPQVILDRRDKTVFDEVVASRIDTRLLRRLLAAPEFQISGVDYRVLNERLEQHGALGAQEVVWMRNLASVHAFVSLW